VTLWDLGTGGQRELRGHADSAYELAFAPDGAHLATGAADGEVRVWTPATGAARSLRGHAGRIEWLAFAPDGAWLASCADDGQVRLWSIARDEQRLLTGAGSVALAYSGSGDLTSGGVDGVLRQWTSQGAGDPRPAHAGPVYTLAVSQDGAAIASSSDDGVLRIARANPAPEPILWRQASPITALAWHDVRLAWASYDGTVHTWQPGTSEPTLLGRHEADAISLAWSPLGDRIASAGGDGTIRLWAPGAPGADTAVLRGPAGAALRVTWSPDGNRVAATGEDGAVWLWDVGTSAGQPVLRHGQLAYDVRFSGAGDRLASSGWDGSVRVLDLVTDRETTLPGPPGRSYDLAFSPDDAYLAATHADGTVRVWHLASGSSRVLRVAGGVPMRVLFSPDGQTLVAAGRDAPVQSWRAPFFDMPPAEADRLGRWLDSRTSATVSAAGSLASPAAP
jgi:WD40 repeat protein